MKLQLPRRLRWIPLLGALLGIACAGSPSGPPEPRLGGGAGAASLSWPVVGRVSSGFGQPRSTHRHQGIDIRSEPGTPVRAAASGRVTFSGRMRGYGNVVILDHGSGLETRYAHNRGNDVHVGDVVDGRQKIAEVGASGNATAPHVHFEVRKRGRALDPMPFLASMPASSR